MSFNIHLLDNLDYEEAEDFLDNYIDTLIELFCQSPEGKAYAETTTEEIGGWIYNFLDYGYRYEELTPAKMSKTKVKLLMEQLLPRKVTVFNKADADTAIPELLAFWSFLEREYHLRSAKTVITYLRSIENKFGNWLMDPARAGMAKTFFLGGIEAGFDMTTQEGLDQFKEFYNAQLANQKPSDPPKTAKPTPKKTKGFQTWQTSPSSSRKKK